MNKNDLIEYLNGIEGNPEIVLSSDPEGNSHHPLVPTNICTGYYTPENRWSGEFSAEDEDIHPTSVKCVAFYP